MSPLFSASLAIADRSKATHAAATIQAHSQGSDSPMKIACLGWGSLVWNPGVLRCVGGWHTDGPELPLEFARTSQDGRLTLVLTAGARPVPCLWTEVEYTAPHHAQEALAGREGCTLPGIGLWPGDPPAHNPGADAIAAWCAARGFDAVVWTALKPKFEGVSGNAPATAEAALTYLKQLDAGRMAKAQEYVERAPAQVQTAFRAVFEQELGWHARS